MRPESPTVSLAAKTEEELPKIKANAINPVSNFFMFLLLLISGWALRVYCGYFLGGLTFNTCD